MMLLLRKAHLGEVSVTVWPQVLKEMCARAEHPRARVSQSHPPRAFTGGWTSAVRTYEEAAATSLDVDVRKACIPEHAP